MNRRSKRAIKMWALMSFSTALPSAISLTVSVILRSLLGWEERLIAVFLVGVVISIAFGVMWANLWDDGSYGSKHSPLQEWVNEPEPVKEEKSKNGKPLFGGE